MAEHKTMADSKLLLVGVIADARARTVSTAQPITMTTRPTGVAKGGYHGRQKLEVA